MWGDFVISNVLLDLLGFDSLLCIKIAMQFTLLSVTVYNFININVE